jgi:glycosyltransferase involved in cell wall biosynthesis
VTDGSATSGSSRWIVIREGQNQRWGGELRRRQIFARLAERTGATVVEKGWYPVLLRRAARGRLGRLPGPLLYRLPMREPKPRFAASEKLRDRLLDAAIAVTDPAVVAVYDDPVAQARALGVPQASGWLDELAARQRRNVATFRWLVAPTSSFAKLAGLPLDRLIVGGNGTDVGRIRVGPWPSRPAVGIVSGAAPGRGLELLVDAVAGARSTTPDLVLRMWLVSTSDASEAYLRDFRTSVADRPWVEIGTAPYDRLSETLATASVLCIPHPPNDYMDVALPVKLFDSLAAGRPLVVTPRTETAALVRGLGVGAVADGDRAEDLAAAIVGLLSDETRLRATGARAREAAERHFDWRIVGDRIASAVLAREGGRGSGSGG